jgi:hypothetical protein
MSLFLPLLAVWVSGFFLRQVSGGAGGRGFPGLLSDAAESFGLGAAACYLVFLWGVWLGPAGGSWLALAPLLSGAAWLWKRSRGVAAVRECPGPDRWKTGEVAAAGAVLLVLAAALALLLATPLLDWDARILWALKAKVLAAERTFLSDTFRDPYRLHIHPRYPLFVPWLASLPAGFAGGFRELYFQVIAGLVAVLGALQLYRLGRDSGSRQAALLGTLLMVLTAAWLRNLFAAGVELALLLFLLLGVQALWRWLERRRTADLVLAAVYLFGGASVKNEGLLLGLCVVGALGVLLLLQGGGSRRRGLAAVLGLLTLWGLLMAVWWWHLRFIPPVSDENYPARLRPEYLVDGLQRLPLLFRELGAHALDVGSWHLTWAAFPLLCGWAWRRGLRSDPKALLLALICLLYWGGVVVIYLLSPWRDLAQHVGITFDRVFLPLLPLAILLLQRTLVASPRAARSLAESRHGAGRTG